MADWLPSQYSNATNYFTDILSFLHKYEWIYNWNVTNILIENAVSKIPPEWLSVLSSLSDTELKRLHRGQSEVDWPESLQSFLSNCQKFQLSINHFNTEPNLDLKQRKGLKPKKDHEVVRLVSLINSECSKVNIKFVVDVGSGLGYLCEVLHIDHAYRVVGLESKRDRTLKSIERRDKLLAKGNVGNSGSAEYYTCHLSHKSVSEVESILSEVNGDSSTDVCLVGLHVCGDLAPAVIHLFDQINQFKLLILLPCCYHKRELRSASKDEETFKNFPMSNPLRKAVKDFEKRVNSKGARFLRRPLLRLAAQRDSSAWEQVEEYNPNGRLFQTLATALVYLLAHQEGSTLKRKKTQPATCRCERISLNDFVSDAYNRYEFVSSTPKDEKTRLTRFRRIFDDHEPYLRHIEILLALQSALQPVAEALVLADCIAKLNTQGYSDARLVRLTDPVLSPRGVALIAVKNDDKKM